MATPSFTTARALGYNELEIEANAAFLSGQNSDGTAFAMPISGSITAAEAKAGTATLTNVDVSDGANHTLLAANAARLGATFYNDSTANLFLKFGTTAASSTSFTVKIASQGYYEIPTTATYTGQVTGIEDAANGTVRVTELTA